MARQLAVDDEDLSPELVPNDATAGGQISDDEKAPGTIRPSPAALALAQAAPTAPPKQSQPGMATKASGHTGVMVALYPDAAALLDAELGWAKRLGREARKHA